RNVSFTDKTGVVYRLVHDIDEDDFKDTVQIIGWLYQYYNEERKNEVINLYKGTVKKEDIPAATQLFTPDWVVRFMVDNSLGRYWIERNPQSRLREKLEFLAAPEDGLPHINEKIQPKDVTFLDPCAGSGHILVYAFDVLMEIYRECGCSDSDAAVCILRDNLYGLDIDDRVCRLACFEVMMKARSYNRNILDMGISPNIRAIQESNRIEKFVCGGVTADFDRNETGEYLVQKYRNAKEIGSLQTVEARDYAAFRVYLKTCRENGRMRPAAAQRFAETAPLMEQLAAQAEIMSAKYAVVCTNPPYMNKLEGSLKKFVTKEYKPYGGDLFGAFMYRDFGYCREDGYSAFMAPFVWMFIRSYRNLREYIIRNKSITALVQMEYSAFEEATVPVCTFVLKNAKSCRDGIFIRLSDFKGGMEAQRQKTLDALADAGCSYRYAADINRFLQIPGEPIAYWAGKSLIQAFGNRTFSDFAMVTNGMFTCDNKRFLRLWHEVAYPNTFFGCTSAMECAASPLKWYPYNKGGNFRRWYGNHEYVIDFKNFGKEISEYRVESGQSASFPGQGYYFQESVSWSLVSSSKFGVRYYPPGFVFDIAGSSVFPFEKGHNTYLLGLLASEVTFCALGILNPTINYQAGDIRNMPVKFSDTAKETVDCLVKQNIEISRTDWDSFEISWNFRKHPLLRFAPRSRSSILLKTAYESWKAFTEEQFCRLKKNEEELNAIFIDLYSLRDVLSPAVADRDVTVARIFDTKEDIPEGMRGGYTLTKRDVIKSFLSYAVGCMLGRYSLDADGLAYAGGKWDDGRYSTFLPNQDNIIPITDGEYFKDDIVGRFAEFVKAACGEEMLEENLDFIADALGGRGKSPREVIRNYFLRDFYGDHVKTYQKRPIYWLFDSGREDGLKALVYMHRYDENTVDNLRTGCLRRMQRVYESEISRMRETAENSRNAQETAAAEKRRGKLIRQLKETGDYDGKLARLAAARIAIDPDDGVKANYEKVQTGADGKKLEVLAKI
ncbi:MAG TPA: BREX-1 system adenine-specific DNA-methyltransferase PglX, partial [Caproiciproducens sp.]|nr:BREX-1 system adenine-specific DNA-methyltransferase PglX [Caproiciproducens sp.]